MNKIRRKALAKIITKLEALESLRQEIQEMLEEVQDEEQEALDNMPESLQEGERGQQMEEYIDTMASVVGDLDCMGLDGLADQLRDIVEV
jgi:hypothetical protein